jgi:hypothetical protein
LQQLVACQRKESLDLLHFIASHQDIPLDFDPSASGKSHVTPIPTRDFVSRNGVLAPYV